ncbi:MAG: hypothetical protein K6F84_04240 [Lachnospiraceae bacterium]|nr:hypothetical protein [Lachnospiraceae bacterium]
MKIKIGSNDRIYIGQELEEKNHYILMEKLKKDPVKAGLYILILSENEGEEMEIIKSCELLRPVYKYRDIKVCGIAKNRDDAFMLVKDMAEDILKQDEKCSFREYFK